MLRALIAAAGACLALLPQSGMACGALVSPDGGAKLEGFGAVVAFEGQQERLITQIAFQSSTDFVWLMALPAAPQIAVDTSNAYQLAEGTVQVPRRVHPHFGFGAAGAPGGVTELSRQQVGGLDFLTLRGDTAAGLQDYLESQGFHLHGLQGTQIQAYLDRHWVLAAAKAHPGGITVGGLQPVSFAFATDQAVYPMGLLDPPEGGVIPMRLYLLTPWRPTATSGETAVTPDEGGVFSLGHDTLDLEFSDTLAAQPTPTAATLVTALGVPTSSWLSRYEARWDAARATTDLTFGPAASEAPLNFKALQAKYDRELNQELPGFEAGLILVFGLVILLWLAPFIAVAAVVIVVVVLVLRSRRPMPPKT